MERWLVDRKRLLCLFHGYPDRLGSDTRKASRLGQITGQADGSRFSHENRIMDKTDGTKLVEGKMREAGSAHPPSMLFSFNIVNCLRATPG